MSVQRCPGASIGRMIVSIDSLSAPLHIWFLSQSVRTHLSRRLNLHLATSECGGADVQTDAESRLRSGTGHGLADIWRLRTGQSIRVPDAVVRPKSEGEVLQSGREMQPAWKHSGVHIQGFFPALLCLRVHDAFAPKRNAVRPCSLSRSCMLCCNHGLFWCAIDWRGCHLLCCFMAMEKLYNPPPSSISGQKTFFRGGRRVCICHFWGPTRQEFYTPLPFLYTPHPNKGIFRGGAWGCIKFGPVLCVTSPCGLELAAVVILGVLGWDAHSTGHSFWKDFAAMHQEGHGWAVVSLNTRSIVREFCSQTLSVIVTLAMSGELRPS